MDLQWRAVTRFHDWFDQDREVPRRILGQARQANIIGAVNWFETGPDDEREEVESDDGVLERLLDLKPEPNGSLRFAVGGTDPHPWEATLLLQPYLKAQRQVRGYNMLNLWFPVALFSGKSRSDELAATFRANHQVADTEFAFIHPYPRASELTSPIDGQYGDPLTLGPMFAGVFWANFLNREHLAFFDTSRLRNLETYEVQWDDGDGLYLRASPAVDEAVSPAVEEEMFRLTEVFRRALR